MKLTYAAEVVTDLVDSKHWLVQMLWLSSVVLSAVGVVEVTSIVPLMLI